MTAYEAAETAAQLLKKNTTEPHLALEAVVEPQLQALKSKEDYVAFLKRFYGCFKPVESLIEKNIDATVLPDIAQRRKAERIVHDLTFSNTHIEPLPVATQLPQIGNAIEAFGALYVLEGSTLGGRGITRMLLKNEALQLQLAEVTFFSGYGEQTGVMWTSFLNSLNQFTTTPTAIQQQIATANNTFTFFKIWLQQ